MIASDLGERFVELDTDRGEGESDENRSAKSVLEDVDSAAAIATACELATLPRYASVMAHSSSSVLPCACVVIRMTTLHK